MIRKDCYNESNEVKTMAKDYIVINDKSDVGTIAMNKSIFESIAEISIDEIENAVKIRNSKISKPLTVKVEDNKLMITADIKVRYGASVAATCEKLQNKIYENITFMTGYKPADVTVNVTGFEIQA